MSEYFLSRHCFALNEPDPSTTLIGLSFEPLNESDATDVEGVIWVERSTGRLDRVEFTYTGSGPAVRDQLAGGVIRFAELPDGRWIVRDWRIRAPSMRAVRSPTGGAPERYMVADVHETGSEVASVRGPDFEWTPDRPMARLVGEVFDSTRLRPLSGAIVRVAGRGWRAVADGNGAFELPSLPVGRYRVVFEHARLDTLGMPPVGRDVELAPGDVAVALAVPSSRSLLAEACPNGRVASVVGRVTAPDLETPVSGALISAVLPNGDTLGASVSSPDGWYRICERPTAGALSLSVRGAAGFDSFADVPEVGYGVADLVLGWTTVRALARPSSVSILGFVVDGATSIALPSATIDLIDAEDSVVATTLTDARGEFRLTAGRDPGTRLRVRAPRYQTATGESLPSRSSRHRVRVELAPEAVEVEGLLVTVDGGVEALDVSGFYERRRQFDGAFLDLDDSPGAAVLSDVLLRLPQVQRWELGPSNTTEQRVQLRGALRASSSNNCMPSIYLDGRLARWGRKLVDDGPRASYSTLDDLVAVHDVLAIEVYDTPSSIPAQFTGPGSRCGVIVVWTR